MIFAEAFGTMDEVWSTATIRARQGITEHETTKARTDKSTSMRHAIPYALLKTSVSNGEETVRDSVSDFHLQIKSVGNTITQQISTRMDAKTIVCNSKMLVGSTLDHHTRYGSLTSETFPITNIMTRGIFEC
ncbi:hypothetical protein AcW1_008544 [Taiwanofungus camphoratus]|nr:hypothetical protein AcV5_008830 [Antrodia cinnamomea]KAI0951517.1 hypothetical protein AcW1_008544 [Antrodia cinnamomea]